MGHSHSHEALRRQKQFNRLSGEQIPKQNQTPSLPQQSQITINQTALAKLRAPEVTREVTRRDITQFHLLLPSLSQGHLPHSWTVCSLSSPSLTHTHTHACTHQNIAHLNAFAPAVPSVSSIHGWTSFCCSSHPSWGPRYLTHYNFLQECQSTFKITVTTNH